MKIHHVLLFCFLLAKWPCVSAQAKTITGIVGQNIRVTCDFSLHGSRKLFCKGDCTKENILIETTTDSADNSKYNVVFYGSWMSRGTLFVTIRQLTKSDEGPYRCSTGNFVENVVDIYLVVKDAATTSTTWSTPSVTVTFSETSTHLAGFFWPLVICVPAIVLLLAVVLLFLHKLKTKKKFDDLNQRKNLNDGNMEMSPYEICPPLYTREESIYQNLDPVTKDLDQIYSTLT